MDLLTADERATWPPTVVEFFDDMDARIEGRHKMEHSPEGRAEMAARRWQLLALARSDVERFQDRLVDVVLAVVGDG